MMQVQMPKFVKISSDFICMYRKIAGGRVLESPGNFCNQESGNPGNVYGV